MHLKKTSKLVNFCVAILILKIKENTKHFQHIRLYYLEKGKNASETHTERFALCVTDRTCQKWFVRCPAGDFSLDDAPRSGGPAEVDSDQIET